MEETKERNPRPRKPDRRHKRDPRTWAEKRENGNSSLRIKEPDQIPDHKDPHADKLKQPKLRDVEMQQQGSHETESTRATNLDRERSEPKTISEDERIQSGYQVRPGERICRSYPQTGLCDHGSNCLFNHPTCKFFRRGFCKDGSDCKFIHAKNNEAPRLPNTMHQALPSNVKNLAEFSHPKDSDGAEPMRQVYNRSLSHDDDLQEQRQRYNTEWQRSESQENVQEHRQRDTTEWKRYFEMGRRDAQEIVKQHRQRELTECQRYFEMGRRDAQEIVKQHRQREKSGRQRYLEEEKSEAHENAQEQRLMATTLDRKFDERKHQTESSSMAEKREDIAAGYKRMGIENGEGWQV